MDVHGDYNGCRTVFKYLPIADRRPKHPIIAAITTVTANGLCGGGAKELGPGQKRVQLPERRCRPTGL